MVVENIFIGRIKEKLFTKFGANVGVLDWRALSSDDQCLHATRLLVATAIIHEHDSSTADAFASITDKGNDFGIDGIHIDKIKKTVTFVQSKFITSDKSAVGRNDMVLFVEGLTKIFADDYSEFNDLITSMKADIQNALLRSDFSFNFMVISTSTKPLPFAAESVVRTFLNLIDSTRTTTKFIYLNREQVYEFCFINDFHHHINVPEFTILKPNTVDTPQKIIFGITPAYQIVELYKRYNTKLFNSNIRFYKGDNTLVNSGIIDVVKTRKEHFVLFNNGIKVICSSATRKPYKVASYEAGIYELKDFSIVNGAQTTGTLSGFTEAELEGVNVFITIISLENAPNPEQLTKEITTLSNTQNRIEPSDFASLDPVHSRLKRELMLDGKDYIFKSGDAMSDSNTTISLTSLAFAHACFLGVDHAASIKNAYSSLFIDIKGDKYKKIFPNDINKYFAWNITQIYVDIINTINEIRPNYIDTDLAYLTHGYTFIANLIFDYLRETDYWTTSQYLEITSSISIIIRDHILMWLPYIRDIQQTFYSDKFIPNIFRTKRLAIALKESIMFERAYDIESKQRMIQELSRTMFLLTDSF